MLNITRADVAAEPFPHVVKQGILPDDIFAALKRDYPSAEVFAEQKAAHGSTGSRTGAGFDIYRGERPYVDLMSRSEAWREFDAYINSERFADTFREVFADHLDTMGLRVKIRESHVDSAYAEPREVMTETATAGDKAAAAVNAILDPFRKPAPVDLFTRLDIHRSVGGYGKPPHCDRPNRLCSLIVYFTDTEAAGMRGGELEIYRHVERKDPRNYERHPKPANVELAARLKPKPNLGVFFPCMNNSYHGVTRVLTEGVERDFLYINISGRVRSLW